MGLYGNEYFVTDRLSVLEEALNNELSNFDSIIESFDIESINEMRMASRPEIVIRRTISDIVEKIKELWEKFINWFKKAIKDINITAKKTNMERLLLSAKKVKDKEPTKDINNIILYSIRTDGTEHYKQTHSDIADNIKEVSYGVKNFQKLNKEIFSHLDKLNINNLSGDTNIQAANIETIDKIKELENLQDSFKFEKIGSMDAAYAQTVYSAASSYYGVFVDIVKDYDKVNDYIKKFDKVIKDFTKMYKDNYKKFDKLYYKDTKEFEKATRGMTTDEKIEYDINHKSANKAKKEEYKNKYNTGKEEARIFRNLVTVLRDLSLANFKMLNKTYQLSTRYSCLILGKNIKELKED